MAIVLTIIGLLEVLSGAWMSWSALVTLRSRPSATLADSPELSAFGDLMIMGALGWAAALIILGLTTLGIAEVLYRQMRIGKMLRGGQI